MRIVLLTSWHAAGAAGSGVAASVRGCRDALRAAGEDVRIVCPARDRAGYIRNSVARIAFNHRLRPLDLAGAAVVAGFDFDGFALPRGGPPLVQVNGGVLADIVCFERGPVRWTLAQLAQLEGRAARRAAAVAAPSRYAADTVARLYGVPAGRIEVVPFGIDLADWDMGLQDVAPVEAIEPVILCVARLYPRKGIDLLLAAFAHVIREVPVARLEIVGAGLLDRWLAAAIATHPGRDRIAWHGDQPPAALPAFYRRAAVFCLPSRHETFGFAFLEAMASARPVVALHATAVPEMVRHGETGLLARREDPDELGALLVRLLRDPAEARALGAAGRTRAAGYSWSATAASLLDLFSRVQ
mgnify:CR=1 FL=1